jgi:uncharacterized membrane protein
MVYEKNNPVLWIPLFLVGVGLNISILWYLLITFPFECSRIAAESQGQVTCGLNAGAYLIAGVSLVILLLLVILFMKWSFESIARNSK